MRVFNIFTMSACAAALSLALCGSAGAQAEPVRPTPATSDAIQLNFRDATLDSVLQYLSEAAGLVVVSDTPVEGRVTVVSRQPLNVEEVVALINTVLKEKGYAAVRMGNVLKIMPLDKAKKASIPVRWGSDPAQIQPTDRLVTQVIPLRSVDAVKLKTDLAPLISSSADLSSNASSNALILTDTEANIRRVVQIVSALDRGLAGAVDVKVFVLKYADADSVAKVINEVFKVDETTSAQAGASARMRRFFRARMGGQQGSQDTGRRQDKVRAAADRQTNTVVVSGPPDTLKVVERVVGELDSDTTETPAVFVYHLKNADAKNLEAVLTRLFADTSSSVGGRATSRSNSRGRSSTGGASTSTAGAAADLAGQVTVVADEDSNALNVMTPSKNFERVRQIIAELDQPVPQVLIKVLIAEVTHEDALDLGVEFSALNVGLTGKGSTILTDFDVAADTSGLVYKLVEKDVTAAVRLLQTVGKLDVLSRPYILASDNKEATITVGQEVPFIRNTRTTETGQTINTIEYEDIGIILKVTPHVNPEGLVIMDVSPEISTLTGSTVPISETVNAEVFAKRSAQSRVAIQDGQTIVIGGLMEDRKTENVRSVPILGDIPLLGYLFRRTVTNKSKTELLIFLTPHVAKKPAALKRMSTDEMEGSNILPKAVEPGAFDKHMEGLRRGSSGTSEEKDSGNP